MRAAPYLYRRACEECICSIHSCNTCIDSEREAAPASRLPHRAYATMKLKGQLTDHGARLLWKSFLPTLEKFGKTCQLLLGPDEVYLIQTSLNTDGVHATAKLASDTLFEPGSYRCQSKHHDLIAFTADVGLLLRVLKGAAANAADSVEVKLTIRQVADAVGAATSKPFLCFTATGPSLHVVQDVPISKPYNVAELEQLVAAKDVGPYCPSYCDLGPELGAAQAIADRLKALHDTALLAVSKTGDAHLLVQTPSVTLGAQLRDLPVYPTSAYVADGVDRSKPVNEQLQGALEDGTAAGAYVALKQLARVLHATPLSEPSQVLCGIAEGGGHVHVLCVFRDPSRDDPYDERVTLTFKLPVRADS